MSVEDYGRKLLAEVDVTPIGQVGIVRLRYFE